ncbi:MAG: carboxy terminal-processing peptidase [Verrucomicrobiae bacterium]|nr:carboxy terminal-processing peptidase [Verrucomicrobiae bacterium]
MKPCVELQSPRGASRVVASNAVSAVKAAMVGVALLAGWLLCGAGEPSQGERPHVDKDGSAPADPVEELVAITSKYSRVKPLVPGPQDGMVAAIAARVLTNSHYLRRPLDGEMSVRFFERFVELLDPLHMHFLKTDLEEFEQHKRSLGEMVLRTGDMSVACEIFARFVQRIDQRVGMVAGLLRTNRFEFGGDDSYSPNRKHADWPRDLQEAQALWYQHLRYEYLQEKLNKHKPDEIRKTLSSRYKRLLKSWGEMDHEDLLQIFLSALAQAYDPHSDYMGKAQLENFAINMKLSLFGIGALLRMEDDYCKIESLTPGGPAARSKKLKPNDKIIAVQQKGGEPVDVVGWKLQKIVELIRGPKGTEVTLTLIPADATDPSERKTVTLVRDEIKLEDQEAKAKIFDVPHGNAGYIRLGVIDLPSFYATFEIGSPKKPDLVSANERSTPKSTTADVQQLLKKLISEKVRGVILDLRRNGGGSLEEAIKLTGLFIKEGPIVQVKDADGDIIVESDPDPTVAYDGPLIVLPSRFSASASEILAGALQDYGRALIVGDKSTHGKGTVQTICELNRFARFPRNYNPGAVKVTIRKFYRANGESTQLRGVTPDIILPSVANYLEVGESAQEHALGWDTIPAAKFEKLDRISPILSELRRRTEERQAKDPEFGYVREDIEVYRKAQAENKVSLNEAQRLKEREEAEARARARKAERKARPESKEKVYEITLKLAAEPGLPPPLSSTNSIASASEVRQEEDVAAAGSDEEEQGKSPSIDVAFEEAKRILIDLIELWPGAEKEVAGVSRK